MRPKPSRFWAANVYSSRVGASMFVKTTLTSENSSPQPRQKLKNSCSQADRLRPDPFHTIPSITKAKLAKKGYCITDARLLHDEAKTLGLTAVPPGPE